MASKKSNVFTGLLFSFAVLGGFGWYVNAIISDADEAFEKAKKLDLYKAAGKPIIKSAVAGEHASNDTVGYVFKGDTLLLNQ